MRRPGPTAVPIAITALGGVLRFATLDLQSFDFDEAFTVGPVLDGSLDHALDTIPRTESSPPLYYVLAWLWTRPFGLGEVGVRSLSALLGTALVPVAYGTARELAGPRAGVVAAALVAVSPQLVFYSQEARAYALFALLATLSLWAFLVARRSPGRRTLALWALASAAALLTHYFAVFLVVPEALWLLLVVRPRRSAVAACAGVAAVAAALIPLVARQTDGRTDWISDSPLGERIKEVAKKSLTGEYDPTTNWQLAALALVLLAAIAWSAGRIEPETRRGLATVVALTGAFLGLPLALDLLGGDYLVAKNVIAAIPLLAVAVACALGPARAAPVGPAVAGFACLALAAIAISAMTDVRLRREDYRGVAAALGRPAPDVAVLTPYHGSAPLAVYIPGAVRVGAAGVSVREVELVQPLRRADSEGPARPATPPPPPGFRPAGRDDRPTFTSIRYRAEGPIRVTPAALAPLAPGTATFPPALLVWP